jgi:hypothetical protein
VALAKAKPPPARSAERERLAEAIEQLRAARARHATLEAALARAERAVIDGHGRIAEATDAVEATQKAVADHWIDGADDVPPPNVREARARLADVEDACAAARSGRDELKRRLAEGSNIELYRLQQRNAAEAVLRAELQGRADVVADEIARTFITGVEQAELVRRLAERAGLFPTARNSLNQVTGVIGPIGRLAQADILPGSAQARARGAARYEAMVDALVNDADAVLEL